MPQLIRLYIRHCLIGLVIAIAFVGLLFAFDVGRLWSLVSNSDVGMLATIMLVIFNALVFSGVQFAVAIMRMASKTEDTSVKLERPVVPLRTRRTSVPDVRNPRKERQRDSA